MAINFDSNGSPSPSTPPPPASSSASTAFAFVLGAFAAAGFGVASWSRRLRLGGHWRRSGLLVDAWWCGDGWWLMVSASTMFFHTGWQSWCCHGYSWVTNLGSPWLVVVFGAVLEVWLISWTHRFWCLAMAEEWLTGDEWWISTSHSPSTWRQIDDKLTNPIDEPNWQIIAVLTHYQMLPNMNHSVSTTDHDQSRNTRILNHHYQTLKKHESWTHIK